MPLQVPRIGSPVGLEHWTPPSNGFQSPGNRILSLLSYLSVHELNPWISILRGTVPTKLPSNVRIWTQDEIGNRSHLLAPESDLALEDGNTSKIRQWNWYLPIPASRRIPNEMRLCRRLFSISHKTIIHRCIRIFQLCTSFNLFRRISSFSKLRGQILD